MPSSNSSAGERRRKICNAMLLDRALKFRKPFRWHRCKPRAPANIGNKLAPHLRWGVGPRKRIKRGNLVLIGPRRLDVPVCSELIAGHLTPGFIVTRWGPPWTASAAGSSSAAARSSKNGWRDRAQKITRGGPRACRLGGAGARGAGLTAFLRKAGLIECRSGTGVCARLLTIEIFLMRNLGG